MSDEVKDLRPDVHEMHVNRAAVDVIVRCNHLVDSIGQYYGLSSDRYRKAEQSWRRNLSQLFNMFFGGESWISWDAEYSLFVRTNSKFVYGLIFHAERRGCTLDGCKAYANDDGHVWTYGADGQVGILDHEHEWSYPLDAPTPGDWSFHS